MREQERKEGRERRRGKERRDKRREGGRKEGRRGGKKERLFRRNPPLPVLTQEGASLGSFLKGTLCDHMIKVLNNSLTADTALHFFSLLLIASSFHTGQTSAQENRGPEEHGPLLTWLNPEALCFHVSRGKEWLHILQALWFIFFLSSRLLMDRMWHWIWDHIPCQIPKSSYWVANYGQTHTPYIYTYTVRICQPWGRAVILLWKLMHLPTIWAGSQGHPQLWAGLKGFAGWLIPSQAKHVCTIGWSDFSRSGDAWILPFLKWEALSIWFPSSLLAQTLLIPEGKCFVREGC